MYADAKLAGVEPDDRLAQLAEALFVPTGVDGVYGRTGAYEGVVEALAALIFAHRPPGAQAPGTRRRRQMGR